MITILLKVTLSAPPHDYADMPLADFAQWVADETASNLQYEGSEDAEAQVTHAENATKEYTPAVSRAEQRRREYLTRK